MKKCNTEKYLCLVKKVLLYIVFFMNDFKYEANTESQEICCGKKKPFF